MSFFAASPVKHRFPSGGPRTSLRPDCTAHQIKAAAFTESSADGVLGVVELKGTKFYRVRHRRLRCALNISKGPRRFLAAGGRRLHTPRGRADRISRSDNFRSWVALEDGAAAWGFGWFGTYCGHAPRYVVMTLSDHLGILKIPYEGPTPPCPMHSHVSISSTLTDGPAGAPDQPVQPAPPSYLHLTTSAQFVGTTTQTQPAPVEVTISDTSSQPVALVPCPVYALRTEEGSPHHPTVSTASFGGKTPGCRGKTLTVTPTQPVTFRITRRQLSFFTEPPAGSTFTALIDLAGMPTAQASTAVN